MDFIPRTALYVNVRHHQYFHFSWEKVPFTIPSGSGCLCLEDIGRTYSQPRSVVRIWPEDMSSGLWSGGEHLGMIDYVDTDLPFALIRRLTHWQQMYDDLDEPVAHNVAQWDAFDRERLAVARALQTYWGECVRVEVQYGHGGWIAVRPYRRKPPETA